MSGIASMAIKAITVSLCLYVAGCSTGPNQPSSDLVPVNNVSSVPGAKIDSAQWSVLERIEVGNEFVINGTNFRKIDDYYSARKSRCFKVINVPLQASERDYQVVCHDQNDTSFWYIANQILASETGGSGE